MAKTRPLIHALNTGEVSASALARVDQEKLRLAAEQQRNILPAIIGSGQMRPGFAYTGASKSNNQARAIPFIRSTEIFADLELTNGVMRVWVDDALVTRGSVTSTVGDGDFGSSSSWTLGTANGATATIADDVLTLAAPFRGGEATCRQEVTTSNLGEEHALRIDVERGPVRFKIGGTEFGGEYLAETELDTGLHSLAFTPTGVGAGSDSFTVLLLHCDGSDASTTFTDSSSSGHTVTANGDAQIDTAQMKFGTASGLFDGTNDFLSLDGSSEFAFGTDDFTIDMQVRPNSVSGTQMLYDSRPSGTATGDYVLIYLDGNKITFSDANAKATLTIMGSSSLSVGTWHHVAVTRASGITRLFVDGVLQGSGADVISYLNGASRPAIGAAGNDTTTSEFNGWLDEIRVSNGIARWTSNFIVPAAAYGGAGDTYWVQFSTKRETEVIVNSVEVESAGVMEITAPWTTAQLREIRYDQSIDIVYLAHTDWQTRKVERRGDASWSIVLFKSDDGPFTLGRTSDVRLTPGATRGNTTLTSDGPFFTPDHVGCLFRLTHDRFKANFGVAGADRYSDAIRVNGVDTDNDFSLTRSSTWVGTLRLQRSYDDREFGFVTLSSATFAYTTTGTAAIAPGSTFDNVIHYYRVGFGSTDYTSGTAIVELDYSGDSGSGVCRVTGFNSATSVDIEILSDFKNTTATANWKEGEWSDRRGWPSAVSFFDGRLWFLRDDKFWGSESDGFTLFNLDTEGDSGSIQRNIATGGAINTGVAMLALQRLMFLTAGSESTARASSFDEPLTPTNTSVKDASTQGAAAISPVKLDGRGIFVQKSGSKLYQIVYNFEANDYTSRNLNRLNDEIGGDGIKELAVQRQPETYIWGVRDDGIGLILLYDDNEDALGWFTVETDGADGEIESLFVLPGTAQDRLYAWIKRTIDGSTVRYREKMALFSEAKGDTITKLADSGVYTSASSTAVTAAHLYGSTDSLIGWGTSTAGVKTVLTGLSVSTATTAGTIDLGAAYTDSFVGLSYRGRYKSAKLAYGAQGGTALLQQKIVPQIGLIMSDVHKDAIKVGPDFNSLTKFDIRKSNRQAFGSTDDPVVSGHDTVMQAMGGSWNTDHRLCIEIQPGHPATINGIVFDVDTNE